LATECYRNAGDSQRNAPELKRQFALAANVPEELTLTATESVSLCVRLKKLTVFLEVESAISDLS